jgi:hypothetical protein
MARHSSYLIGLFAALLLVGGACAQTIPQLPPASSVNGSDLLEISQGGVSKKATATQVVTGGGGGGGGGSIPGVYVITASAYGCSPSSATSSGDQAPCIQSAINAAYTAGGGVVWVPTGFWNLKSQVVVKTNVTMACVANGNQYNGNAVSYSTTTGSIFSVLWGSGGGSSNNPADAAVVLNYGAGVSGCGFWYPNQNPLTPIATGPTEYGSTILAYDTVGGNVHQTAIGNWCVNCYNFLDFRGGLSSLGMTAPLVENNIGSPIHYGIAVNYLIDWGNFINNHFNAGYIDTTDNTANYLRGWIAANGIAFYLGHNDWPTLLNDQAWGYNNGVQIDATTNCCGAFTDLGPVTLQGLQIDGCAIDVWIQGSLNLPVNIYGGTFTAFNPTTNTAGAVVSVNTGTVLPNFNMIGGFVFGPTATVLSFNAAGQSIGIVNVSGVQTNVVSTAQYAYLIGSAGSVTITGSSYTGYTTGLLNPGTFTNSPVLVGDFQ